MDRAAKIYVAGHRGMVGSAIVRALLAAGHTDVVTRTSAELDLRDGAATRAFLAAEQPATVVMAAARVGGIKANSSEPYDFLHDNRASIARRARRSSLSTRATSVQPRSSSCSVTRARPCAT